MIISFSRKFIFIHIYKVAGTSVRNALKPYAWQSGRYVGLVDEIAKKMHLEVPFVKDRVQSLPKHATALDIQNAYTSRVFDEFFKFAFVRNPWDWQVSLYHYMLDHKEHFQHELIRSMRSFDEYILWRVSEDRKLQKSFVTDEKGNLIVDFVGKYESLRQDFSYICKVLGLKVSLPHLNSSQRHRDYRLYYNDRLAYLVEEAFKEDITFFGYSFDTCVVLP